LRAPLSPGFLAGIASRRRSNPEYRRRDLIASSPTLPAMTVG
jgi:hypothetical protein